MANRDSKPLLPYQRYNGGQRTPPPVTLIHNPPLLKASSALRASAKRTLLARIFNALGL